MAELLTSHQIVDAIIELAREGGPEKVTARALASKLHVSVGALYNYAGSMQEALELTDAALIDQIVSLCMQAPTGEALIDWISDNPGVAQLLFTAQRVHLPFPPVLIDYVSSRSGFADIEVGEVGRAFLAIVSSEPTISALVLSGLSSWAAPLLDALSRAVEHTDGSTGNDGGDELVGYSQDDLIAATIKRIETDDETHSTRRLVRRASVETLASNEPWNFRAIADRTELPLARLHQIGSRSQHLEQAGIDLVAGALALAVDEPAERQPAALAEAIAAAPDSVFDDATDIMNLRALDRVSITSGLRDRVLAWRVNSPGSAVSVLPALIAEVGWLSVMFATRKFGASVQETQRLMRWLLIEMLRDGVVAEVVEVDSPTEIPIAKPDTAVRSH